MTDEPTMETDHYQNQSPSGEESGETSENLRRDLRLSELEECVTASDPAVRRHALRVVCRLASRAPDRAQPFLDHCINALDDDDKAVRKAASRALVPVASSDPVSVANVLVSLSAPFTDDVDDVRQNLFRTVEAIAESIPEVLLPHTATLISGLDDPNEGVRIAAATSIAAIAQQDPKAITEHIDPILRRLEDEAAQVRLQAAITVTAVGETFPRVFDDKIEKISRAARDNESRVRRNITAALGSYLHLEDNPAVRSILFERLSDPASTVRETAAPALRRSVRRQSMCSPEEIEVLIDALADPNITVRTNCRLALKHAGYEDYWRISTESDAEPTAIARAVRQAYRSSEDLNPHAQLAGAQRCSVCQQPFSTPKFDHPNIVCESCEGNIEPYRSVTKDDENTRVNGNDGATDSGLEPTPVSIKNTKCWRQFRFGELVTMRDAHDCDTYAEFLQQHFTRDGTPIQSVDFECEGGAAIEPKPVE